MSRLRPILQHHARVLRRGSDAVQIGLLDTGVVIAGLADDEIEQVTRLSRNDAPPAHHVAVGKGRRRARLVADSTRLSRVVDVLAHHHLLIEEPTPLESLRGLTPRRILSFLPDASARSCAYGLGDDGYTLLRRRSRQRVLIDGEGRLPGEIGRCLREGGVTRLDVGESAAATADLALRRCEGAPPDLVILIAEGAVDHRRGQLWRRHDIAHLPVVIDGPTLRVGPLVHGDGPCLGCLDLHRTDRDPQWPQLLGQLNDRPAAGLPVDAESGLRALAAGLVAMFGYASLDGYPPPAGLSTTYRLPCPQATHHVWRPHPRCRACAARATIVS